jgi:dihydrofolate synthase/folylpolyglutamate synthase
MHGKPLNYREAIAYLFNRLPMYQRVGKVAYKSNLDTTLALDAHFDHPHRSFQSIHIAGTNGKGSVAHMLASVLQKAGYRTGLYTSPHLVDFRERIRIDGSLIREKAVADFVGLHKATLESLAPSFFEMTVAMAFDYFAREKVDFAVVETGMGGRLDSTNILLPLLTVITNIGMDHSQFLGDTLYKIAIEKAGIMKNGIPVVIGETQAEASLIFNRQAREKGCPIVYADQVYRVAYSTRNLQDNQVIHLSVGAGEPTETGETTGTMETDLLGLYQQKNIITALAAIEQLVEAGIDIPETAVREGLSKTAETTGLRGRWEVIGHNPLVVCDAGHNREGIREVVKQLRQTPWKKLRIVLGLVDDKDLSGLLRELPAEAIYYFTQSSIPRAMDREKLAAEGLRYGLYGKICPSPLKALEIALSEADREDLVFVGGSTFLVADVLKDFAGLPSEA